MCIRDRTGIGPGTLIIINRSCGNIAIIEQAASNCSDIGVDKGSTCERQPPIPCRAPGVGWHRGKKAVSAGASGAPAPPALEAPMTQTCPWLRFYGNVPSGLSYPEVTLYQAVAATAARVPDT